MTNEKFSEVVADAISEQGLKQTYVAEKIGMTPQLLSAKLHGTNRWQVDQVCSVCKLLGIPPDIWVQ